MYITIIYLLSKKRRDDKMTFGTVILMRKNETFITQSMLSSYMAVETKDYLELILPFVCMCLPETVEEKIELTKIQKLLKQKYGLDIPVNVVEKTLLRLCKQKRGSLVKKITNGYAVNCVYNAEEFENRTNEIKKCIDAVISKMQKYMHKEKFLTDTSYNKMKEYLAVFLDTYNYSVYEDAQSLDYVTLDKRSESNYYVAQFILSEYENDTVEFQNILEIVKGSLVAKSIYYFMNSENDLSKNRIQGTKFVLDTRVLIDVLGMNLEQESIATRELLELIIDNGGKIVTFDYYIEELKGIIHRYEKTPESRIALSLNSFVRNGYSSQDAAAYSNTLKERLNEYHIDIIEKPNYESNISEQSWHIDYVKLRDTLNQQIDYRTTRDDYYSEALLHDADTIEAIAYERGSSKNCSVFNCKIIFITKNTDICRTVFSLYKDERFKKGEVNFAMTDVDLTSIIWLSTFGKNSDLPKLKLLEHAYSACVPSRVVMNEFLSKLHSLEESDKISQEMAIMLRSQYATINDLSEVSHNKEGIISDKTIYEMERRVKNRAEKDVKIKYKKELGEIEREKQEIENDRIAIERRREDLIGEQRKTSKLKQDVEYVINNLEKKRNTLLSEKSEYDRKFEYVKLKQKEIIERGKKRANDFRMITKILLYIFLILISIGVTILFAIGTWKISDLTDSGLVMSYVYVGVVSVTCLIITIISIVKWLGFYVSKVSEKVYDCCYSKYINNHKELFD